MSREISRLDRSQRVEFAERIHLGFIEGDGKTWLEFVIHIW